MKFNFRSYLICSQLIALSIFLTTPAQSVTQPKAYFEVTPYMQLGSHFKGNSLGVSWLSKELESSDLSFEYKALGGQEWRHPDKIEKRTVNGHKELNLFSVEMLNLPPDTTIVYRVSKGKNEIFKASTQSPPSPGKAVSFAVFGDIGQGTEGESKIAGLLKQKSPPMALVVGDIVYPTGSINHYLKNFFPYLNADNARVKGSNVMQSMVTVGIAGNHDLTTGGGLDARDLNLIPDSMAYFVLFKQPLNGPNNDGTSFLAQPRGDKDKIADFLKAAGESYPRMTNFSFDYGSCHFLVLDGNAYMDWTDPLLRNWVENDLKNSKASWKLVAFHQPGFNSDWAHREEQRMRHLCDIFERTGVAVCFSGHSHSFQRSYPIHFKEVSAPPNDREAEAGYVYGTFKIDKSFDGDKNTKPDGVIYVISGAAGAHLTRPEMESEPGQWLPFTKTFSSRHHSISLCQADEKSFSLQQVAEDGSILDHFTINK